MTLAIRPVSNTAEQHTFLTFPWKVYRNDPLWVPPLLPERRKFLFQRQAPFFRRGGEAQAFIAWRRDKPVGTIVAGDDVRLNEQRGTRDCVIGFFECLPDAEAAQALFETAAAWGRQRGLQTLYGPFNLDYEDAYGVLVEGRDRPPAILCGHTPPYYLEFFEKAGFQTIRGDGLAYAMEIDPELPIIKRLNRLAERIRQRTPIHVRGGDLAHIDDEIERIYHLINRALAHLSDFIPWQREALQELFYSLRAIADPELVLFAEIEGRVIGWFPAIPNLNEILIRANGLRYPWDYLRLLYHSRRKPRSLAIKSVLVDPEYWDTGVAVLMFDEMAQRASAKGYRWADLSITSEDNPDTPILARHAGARIYKRYRVFRKQIL